MEATCYHCGDTIIGKAIRYDEQQFCCMGCRTVYSLLKDSQLGAFYTLQKGAGIRPTNSIEGKYDFLEVSDIRSRFVDYEDKNKAHVVLFLPDIHCASCIYLLENLTKINPGIQSCQVNFTKREASISFDTNVVKLSTLALLLDRIGYAPNFGNRHEENKRVDKVYFYKLGVAGFAFGSIMLWSFPEYLGIENDNPEFRQFTSYLTLGVSLPVLFYSSADYFISAFKALRTKKLNLDVPITIGILALYLQSAYTILSGSGSGYMDSFAGFIFFLLIGKWFQRKTYRSLSFERDYTSYFPVAVTRLTNEGKEEIVAIEKLLENDLIRIRNEEILPCDSQLESDEAHIDYSFVTGESETVKKKKGDHIYAGGKLRDKRTEFKVLKKSDRSHLTRLWNEVKSTQPEASEEFSYQNRLSFFFLIGLFVVAFVAALCWAFIDPAYIVSVTVSILIVACPCALALSAPFTYGNIMRVLGRHGLYLKNTAVIEKLNGLTDIVFDKTGTLTGNAFRKVSYNGAQLTQKEWQSIYSLVNSSTHPNSMSIAGWLQGDGIHEALPIESFKETKGQGIEANVQGVKLRIGSASFCSIQTTDTSERTTYFRMGQKTGRFLFSSELREGIPNLLVALNAYPLHLLSGDTDKDRELLQRYFPEGNIHFEQSPQSKYEYIKHLQSEGKNVLMIGDGLNDAGALGIADVGIAVSEDVFRFSPSSDAIIDASKLGKLNCFLNVSNFSKKVLRSCLVFSLAYNAIGLTVACSGKLTPLIAAILMPLSSITVVFISTLLSLSRNKVFKG